MNTERAEFLSQGMNHVEGGWPKDINPSENDQTMRFRKKIEKDDTYVHSVLGLCQVKKEFLKKRSSRQLVLGSPLCLPLSALLFMLTKVRHFLLRSVCTTILRAIKQQALNLLANILYGWRFRFI